MQAKQLAEGAAELKPDGDAWVGELTESAIQSLLSFGGGSSGVSNPKGSAKFWLKAGALVKYEFKLKGTRTTLGNQMPIDTTTSVEIKDVGSTPVAIPAAALKKLQ